MKSDFEQFPYCKDACEYKPSLEEILTKEIIDFLFEDRGVSDEVSQIAMIVTSNILKEISDVIIQEKILPNQYFEWKGTYPFSGYGIKINVRWTFYNVGDNSQITNKMRTSAVANISRHEMTVTGNSFSADEYLWKTEIYGKNNISDGGTVQGTQRQ